MNGTSPNISYKGPIMNDYTIAFFYVSTPTSGPSNSPTVSFCIFDEALEEHVSKYHRFTRWTPYGNRIIKEQNILLLDFKALCYADLFPRIQGIASALEATTTPFQPLSHLDPSDDPEWFL